MGKEYIFWCLSDLGMQAQPESHFIKIVLISLRQYTNFEYDS